MEEYETIRRARAMLEASRIARPAVRLADRTIAGYKVKAKRIVTAALAGGGGGNGIDQIIALAKDTKSANTWFSRRAALSFSFRFQVERLLQDQDKMQRALKALQAPDDPRWDDWRNLVTRIGMYVEWHDQLQSEAGPPIEERRPRHSKRKDMRGLPDDWREKLVARLPNYRAAALTQAVTGCRPDELQKGVKLSIVDGRLVAEIDGSKVTEKSGQPWRRLSWSVDSDSPLVAMLLEEVRGGLAVAKIDDAKRYSGAVRAAGAREWPRRTKSIAPYCFRHQLASDMKASGVDDATISQALGHCADVARSYYGSWQQGRRSGGVAPKQVEAPRPVRVTDPGKRRPSRKPKSASKPAE